MPAKYFSPFIHYVLYYCINQKILKANYSFPKHTLLVYLCLESLHIILCSPRAILVSIEILVSLFTTDFSSVSLEYNFWMVVYMMKKYILALFLVASN